VLDMSSMGLSDATKLESLKTLNSLEELYLNDNYLTSLPANFFDNMKKLTKLRVRSNPIETTLPPVIYTRVANFDCDVASGSTPAQSFTKSPTKSPTVEQPSAYPTSAPSKSPSTIAPTAPTSQPTSTAPSVQPTPVSELSVPTMRSPSVASAAGGDNTLVFALAVAVTVILMPLSRL
jgi:Leucine-rich repeat (LRR) protein